jgi:hypothetical protein
MGAMGATKLPVVVRVKRKRDLAPLDTISESSAGVLAFPSHLSLALPKLAPRL